MMDRLRRFFKPSPEIPTVKMGDVGWSESQLYSGDFPKYNPDQLIGRKGFKIYRNMLLDEQVKAVVKFKRDAITSRDFVFTLDDERLSESEAEERLNIYYAMIDNMAGSFNDGLNYIMTAMYNGFSLTEKMFDIFEHDASPYIGLYKLNPKPFDTFRFDIDEYGNILECVQELDGKEQTIDLDKFVYYVHNPEYDQHYGQSDLREAYRSWYSKDIVIRLYNQFLERFAGGFVVARPTEGMTLAQGTKEYNAIKAAIDNIRQQTSILFPAKMELEMHNPASTDQFEKAIIMHDLQIAKALLVPNLLGVTHQGDTGSYAQANTQLEAFLWTLDADCKRLKDALNEQLFIPLGKLNFADGIGPTIRFKPVSETKKHDTIRLWKDLVQGKAVEASDTDEAHLRELLEFPEKGEPRQSPIPPQLMPGQPPQETPEPNEDEVPAEVEESMTGYPSGRLVSDAAFTAAIKRVSFQVIDRKSTATQNEHTVKIEGKFADMVANTVRLIEEQKIGTPAGDVEAIGRIDFATTDKKKSQKSIEAMLKQQWALGEKHATDEISKAKREQFSVDMQRIADVASDWMKATSFRMFGNLSADMIAIMQQVLSNGLKYTWTTKQIIEKIYDGLTSGGFLSQQTNAEATGRTLQEVQEILQTNNIPPHRLQTAIRTNGFEAINEARYAAFTDPDLDGFVEALEYSAILDDRTTDICQSLNGRIYPADSPEWDAYRPPNHYNCRSLLVPVTVVDTEVKGKDAPKGSRISRPIPESVSPQTGFGGPTG